MKLFVSDGYVTCSRNDINDPQLYRFHCDVCGRWSWIVINGKKQSCKCGERFVTVNKPGGTRQALGTVVDIKNCYQSSGKTPCESWEMTANKHTTYLCNKHLIDKCA